MRRAVLVWNEYKCASVVRPGLKTVLTKYKYITMMRPFGFTSAMQLQIQSRQ